jgi:hypothetical protein
LEESNAIEILKLLAKFYQKTRFATVRNACWTLWMTIRTNYPRANLEVPKQG